MNRAEKHDGIAVKQVFLPIHGCFPFDVSISVSISVSNLTLTAPKAARQQAKENSTPPLSPRRNRNRTIEEVGKGKHSTRNIKKKSGP